MKLTSDTLTQAQAILRGVVGDEAELILETDGQPARSAEEANGLSAYVEDQAGVQWRLSFHATAENDGKLLTDFINFEDLDPEVEPASRVKEAVVRIIARFHHLTMADLD